MKYLAIACGILALVCVLIFKGYVNRGKEITALENDKDKLINTIKEYQNAEMEANKSIKQLRETLKSNQANMDWYRQPLPVDVLNVLQERHNRNRKD